MNPTQTSPLSLYQSPPNHISFDHMEKSKKEENSKKPFFGERIKTILEQHLAKIPFVHPSYLGLFLSEERSLPDPYLPTVFPSLMDECSFTTKRQDVIHAAQGSSTLGRYFLALEVKVITPQDQFKTVEVLYQRNLTNVEEFTGIANNITDSSAVAISSIYGRDVPSEKSLDCLKCLLNGETIVSPTAEVCGLDWKVTAVNFSE